MFKNFKKFKINKDYKNILFAAILSAMVGLISFLITQYYYLPKKQRFEIEKEFQQELLSETEIIRGKIIANNKYILKEFNKVGLGSESLGLVLNKLCQNYDLLYDLRLKTESKGTDLQMKFNNEEIHFIINANQLVVDQKKRLRNMKNLINSFKEREIIINLTENHYIQISYLMDEIVYNENRIYSALKNYYFPMIDYHFNLSYCSFRKKLNIPITKNIREVSQEIENLRLLNINYEFQLENSKDNYVEAILRNNQNKNIVDSTSFSEQKIRKYFFEKLFSNSLK